MQFDRTGGCIVRQVVGARREHHKNTNPKTEELVYVVGEQPAGKAVSPRLNPRKAPSHVVPGCSGIP